MLPAPRINDMLHRVMFAMLWESPQESGSRAIGIICAFFDCEVCKGLSDGLYEGVKCSCGSLAKGCFEFCERLLDWIKVRAVSGQVAQRRPGPLDRLPDASDFVTGEIVHDDDITLAQGQGEKVFDIGQETRSVHRPIEHAGRGDLIVTQGGNECCQPSSF